jgi:hypothetical protein
MRTAGPVQADLAANVLAALLLVLVILIRAGTPALRPATLPGGDASTPVAALRTPLGAATLVAALYDRRPGAAGVSLDLTETAPADLDGLVHGLAPETPVRLYVFSHRHYAAAASALVRAGRRWQEISVPPVLGGTAGWSPAFLALLDRCPNLPEFRAGLARLLGAGSGPVGESGGWWQPGGAGFTAARHRFAAALTGIVLIVGFGAAAAIEAALRPFSDRWLRAGWIEEERGCLEDNPDATRS